jgi:hypothetical protein
MIPQSNGQPVAWLQSLEEAAKGSAKAVKIYTYAEYALVAQFTGKRHHTQSPAYIYNEHLHELLLREPPFPSFEIPPVEWNQRRGIAN